MTYDQAVHFSQTWGLILLVALFACVVLYALWPGNREEFKRTAQTPLANEDDNGSEV